jgi:hypothetical protein
MARRDARQHEMQRQASAFEERVAQVEAAAALLRAACAELEQTLDEKQQYAERLDADTHRLRLELAAAQERAARARALLKQQHSQYQQKVHHPFLPSGPVQHGAARPLGLPASHNVHSFSQTAIRAAVRTPGGAAPLALQPPVMQRALKRQARDIKTDLQRLYGECSRLAGSMAVIDGSAAAAGAGPLRIEDMSGVNTSGSRALGGSYYDPFVGLPVGGLRSASPAQRVGLAFGAGSPPRGASPRGADRAASPRHLAAASEQLREVFAAIDRRQGELRETQEASARVAQETRREHLLDAADAAAAAADDTHAKLLEAMRTSSFTH